ncbi:hypothetical protein [Candidatus Electrothrix sp.]|uniref:hypothetical protein n=1 Tax=Candidatus Electrothrix sp. TaxID=2170559 RepID=UPI004055FDC7
MAIPLRSNETTQGRRMTGGRTLWRANGMTEEQIGKPIIAVVNGSANLSNRRLLSLVSPSI